MKQALLPPMAWLRESGWGRNISMLARAEYRRPTNEHIFDIFYELNEDPITAYVGSARYERIHGIQDYETLRSFREKGATGLATFAVDMSHERSIAGALVPFIEDGHRIVSIGPELARSFLADETMDRPLAELLAIKHAFYVHVEDSDVLCEDGSKLDGFLIVGGPDDEPDEEEPDGYAVVMEIIPLSVDGPRLGIGVTPSPGFEIDPESDQPTIAAAIREKAEAKLEALREQDRKNAERADAPAAEDKATVTLEAMRQVLNVSKDQSIAYTETAYAQADAWARLIGGALRCIASEGPHGIPAWTPGAPQDLVAKTESGATGAKKAQQKLTGMGHMPMIRYEIGNEAPAAGAVEQPPVAKRRYQQPAAAVPTDQAVPRVDRRKARREQRRTAEAVTAALRGSSPVEDDVPSSVPKATPVPAEKIVASIEGVRYGAVIPDVVVPVAGPARHDPDLLEEVDRIVSRCFKDLPSLDSRNWEAAVPPALASMVMRRARVDQMPRETSDATRRRLAADILPRLEGIPTLLADLAAERTANPQKQRAYATGAASIMRDLDDEVVAGLAHPVHVVVDDAELVEKLLFPGVKRQPNHGQKATTIVTAWRRDRTLGLIGLVHEGCLIGLRRIEVDLDTGAIVDFDSESDVLDPQDLLDALHAPIADAILGPVDEFDAWRYERRASRQKPPRSTGVLEAPATIRCEDAAPATAAGEDLTVKPECVPEPTTGSDFADWQAVSRPGAMIADQASSALSSFMEGSAVTRAIMRLVNGCEETSPAEVRNAAMRHLSSIATAARPQMHVLSAPDLDDSDLSESPDTDGVLLITDRVLFEHASPGLAGAGLPKRENAICILYRLRGDGVAALVLQVEADGRLNLAQWSRMGSSPRDADDELAWYVRGAIATVVSGARMRQPSASPTPPAPRIALPRLPVAEIAPQVRIPGRRDDHVEELPRRVVAQARIRPQSMREAARVAESWFAATADRHRLRLVADRRDEGEWTIEHRSEDRLNPSIWSTTLRTVEDDPEALDVIVRTTMTSGVKPRLPTLVRDIAAATPTSGPDGLLRIEPECVRTRSELNHLLRELQSPDRVLPILVMSQDKQGTYMRDPAEIARQSLGVLTVWMLADHMTYDLSDALGQEYRTFNGAVRLFQPRFDPDNDQASRHPRVVADGWADKAIGDMISRATSATVTRYAITDSPVARQQTTLPVVPAAETVAPVVVPATERSAPVSRPSARTPIRAVPPTTAVASRRAPASTAPAVARPKPVDQETVGSDHVDITPRPSPIDDGQAVAPAPEPVGEHRDAPLPETSEPAELPAVPPSLDAAAISRLVEEMLAERLAGMASATAPAPDPVATPVDTAPAVVEEPLLDLDIPPTPSDPVAPFAPTITEEEVERRVEAAVASRFAALGVTELVGAVTSLVGRMDAMIGSTMQALARPADQSTALAEAEARWATERQSFEGLLTEAGEQSSTAAAERDAAVAEVQRLRQALNGMRREGIAAPVVGPEWPSNLDGLADWLENNPLPNVVVTTKAYRGMRKVRYEDMQRLCRTLQLLNGAYVDMRAGEDGARERWEEGLKELRLENKKQTQMGKSIRGGAEYRFEHDGRRWEMDFHIRGIESVYNEHDRLLRIYYAYDKEEGRILIGHMPTHLTTIDS